MAKCKLSSEMVKNATLRAAEILSGMGYQLWFLKIQ